VSPETALVTTLLLPLATSAVCMLLMSFPHWQRCVSVGGSLALLLAAGNLFWSVQNGTYLVVRFGNWPAPFGIVYVADLLSAGLVLLTALMSLMVVTYSLGWSEAESAEWSRFYPVFHGMLFGLIGAFLTGDLFHLYVCFEVMLISSFGMLVFERRPDQIVPAVGYVTLNIFATSLVLLSVAFVYGATGSLNFAELSVLLPQVSNQGLVFTLAVFLAVALSVKVAAFPLFFWLLPSYPRASIPVVAIFSALATKVALYVLIRLNTLVFPEAGLWMGGVFGVVAVLNMLTGVLGAVACYDMRKILAFHSISQIGYMLIGLAVLSPLALAATVFFMLHHSLVKTNLFLVAGVMKRCSGTFHVRQAGGLRIAFPLLAVLFFLQGMSLAGLPPFSGFWGKYLLVQSSWVAGRYVLAAVSLGVSLLTLYSMVKIWNEAFLKPVSNHGHPIGADRTKPDWEQLSLKRKCLLFAPVVVICSCTILIGLCPEPVMAYCQRAAEQVLDGNRYVDAVLQGHSSLERAEGEIP